jgi:hypothetical protein
MIFVVIMLYILFKKMLFVYTYTIIVLGVKKKRRLPEILSTTFNAHSSSRSHSSQMAG